jgi:hypothetical protein
VVDKLLNVYIPTEGVYGTIQKMGAFASVVMYKKDGILYEELLENDDFNLIGEEN